MFDDVPNSIYELAGPVIESYGWKYAVASCSGYAGDPTAGENVYMATKNLMTLLKKGHEVWNHTKTHENMDTATTQAKIRSINVSTAFWGGKGFSNATRFLAWPFGAYDDESITLIKDNGYLMARSIHGDGICPFSAGINPYYINAFAVENANPWRTDTMIEGSIRRGMGMITYAHDAVAGGQGVDSYPAGAKFYMDHFKRWCDRVAGHEANGNVVVTTPIDYYRLCGIDVFSHKFQE
jgi:peptidoglycan/xylan/chitin deacetylase (PgdA/CDA1 family)